MLFDYTWLEATKHLERFIWSLLLVFDHSHESILGASPPRHFLIFLVRLDVADLREMLQTLCSLTLNSSVLSALSIFKDSNWHACRTLTSPTMPLIESLDLVDLGVFLIVGLHLVGSFKFTV